VIAALARSGGHAQPPQTDQPPTWQYHEFSSGRSATLKETHPGTSRPDRERAVTLNVFPGDRGNEQAGETAALTLRFPAGFVWYGTHAAVEARFDDGPSLEYEGKCGGTTERDRECRGEITQGTIYLPADTDFMERMAAATTTRLTVTLDRPRERKTLEFHTEGFNPPWRKQR
jgi:hypothetical protein